MGAVACNNLREEISHRAGIGRRDNLGAINIVFRVECTQIVACDVFVPSNSVRVSSFTDRSLTSMCTDCAWPKGRLRRNPWLIDLRGLPFDLSTWCSSADIFSLSPSCSLQAKLSYADGETRPRSGSISRLGSRKYFKVTEAFPECAPATFLMNLESKPRHSPNIANGWPRFT